MKRLLVFSFSLGMLLGGLALAQCRELVTTPVTLLSNSFEAWKVVTDAMAACGNLTAELDAEFRQKQVPAFSANPSQYTIGGVANATLVPLLNDGLVRPLNDLVERYGQDLSENQLIQVDGQIVAIAMMVNAQHLMYRRDIFDELGLSVPTTYAELLAAARVIQDAGVVDFPLGGTFAAGWDLGQEFVNLYLGLGGQFFNADNTPAVNNETGVAALELLKALSEYMDPEYLTANATFVQQQLQQGRVAMANLWASRAAAMDNVEESQVVGLIEFAAAPAAREGGPPATTLWWDGMVIAANVTDEEAEAAFKLMMEGIRHEVLAQHPDTAIWLSNQPIESRAAAGAIASAQGGAPSYPASNAMGLMHTAIGNNLADFLLGNKSAEEALSDIEADYLVAAREAGLLQ